MLYTLSGIFWNMNKNTFMVMTDHSALDYRGKNMALFAAT